LREVGHAEGGFAKTVDEGSQRLVSFLSDAKEGLCGLMWAATSKMGGEKVGEGVEAIN